MTRRPGPGPGGWQWHLTRRARGLVAVTVFAHIVVTSGHPNREIPSDLGHAAGLPVRRPNTCCLPAYKANPPPWFLRGRKGGFRLTPPEGPGVARHREPPPPHDFGNGGELHESRPGGSHAPYPPLPVQAFLTDWV